MQLDLRYLTDLTRLTLQGHSNHTSGFNAREFLRRWWCHVVFVLV